MTGSLVPASSNTSWTKGAPPYGFDSDHQGNLVPNAEMQDTLARIRELDAAGMSLRSIIAVLDSEGRKPRRGDRWHPASVSRLVGPVGMADRKARQ